MTTNNLSTELARLNALEAKTKPDGIMDAQTLGYNLFMFREAAPDAIALANDLHALIVQAEEALRRVSTSQGFRHIAPSIQNNIDDTLTAIRAAGIGGDRD